MINNAAKEKRMVKRKAEQEKYPSFQKKLQQEIAAHCVFLNYDCYGALRSTRSKGT